MTRYRVATKKIYLLVFLVVLFSVVHLLFVVATNNTTNGVDDSGVWFLKMTHYENEKAFFGYGSLQVSFLIETITILIALLLSLVRDLKKEILGYALIFSGGLINLSQIVVFQKVFDTFVLKNIGYFNIPDLVIFAGIIFLVLGLTEKRK